MTVTEKNHPHDLSFWLKDRLRDSLCFPFCVCVGFLLKASFPTCNTGC